MEPFNKCTSTLFEMFHVHLEEVYSKAHLCVNSAYRWRIGKGVPAGYILFTVRLEVFQGHETKVSGNTIVFGNLIQGANKK